MSSKIIINKDTKREYVKNIFNSISKTYDLLNHTLSFGVDIYWRKKALKGLIFQDDALCLDLAAGTGDFGIQVYKDFQIKVIGYDLAVNSLKLFKDKTADSKIDSNFSFINGEAEKLAIKDETADLVTIAFGIRNFYDSETALKEIHRVLKSRGILNILEFALPKNIFIRFIYLMYFNHILPFIGKLISKEKTAYNYLPASVEEFDKKDSLVSEIIKAGFRQVEVSNLTFGVVRNIKAIKS